MRSVVEHLLERHERDRRHELEERLDRIPQRANGLRVLLWRAVSDDDDRVAEFEPVLFRHEGLWRRAEADGDKPGRILGKFAEIVAGEFQRAFPTGDLNEEQPQLDHRTDRMERELEGCDHPEVAAAPGQRPEEIAVLPRRGADDPPVGRDNFRREQIVATQTGQFGEPSDAAAQGQARDAGMADEAAGRREAMRLRRRVDFAPRRPAAASDATGGRVDGHAVHVPKMDHHAAVAGCSAGVVVPAAPDRDFEIGLARKADNIRDLAGVGATSDDRGLAVDCSIPKSTGGVVVRIAGDERATFEARSELSDCR